MKHLPQLNFHVIVAQQEWLTLTVAEDSGLARKEGVRMSFHSGVVHARTGLMAILGALYVLMGILVRRKAKQNSAD